jgi:hypothetical protein
MLNTSRLGDIPIKPRLPGSCGDDDRRAPRGLGVFPVRSQSTEVATVDLLSKEKRAVSSVDDLLTTDRDFLLLTLDS